MKFYRSIPTIHAMSFDLDDTLYANGSVITQMEQQLLIWLHQNHPVTTQLTKADWLHLKMRVAALNPMLKHDVTLWRLQQLTLVFLECGYSLDEAQQAAQSGVEVALYWRSQLTVPHETFELLQQLSARFPLVAITNGNVDLDAIGLAPYFSLVLKAGIDGRAKPSPDMFLQAQQFLGCDAKHILHIGDHPKTDVQGAKLSSLSACWLNETGCTISQNAKMQCLPDVEINNLYDLSIFL